LLAEGAAAVVLSRDGDLELTPHAGAPVFKHGEAGPVLRRIHAELVSCGEVDLVVGGANGTSGDAAETAAIALRFPQAALYQPKLSLGEPLGASALLQVVVAALALRKGTAPAVSESGKRVRAALVTALGFNQQAGGALLRRAE
jgi:3-oxoacyl-(acyl-carrier-protein) synthase